MNQFPDALKTWRRARRLSQLELAMQANVSSRHISFLETGRAQPSREMVIRLGETLGMPLAARNEMLTYAGFASRYPGREWSEQEMTSIRAALEHMLVSHAPYPAFAIDRVWNIIRVNEPAKRLFGMIGIAEGVSLIDLVLSDVLPAYIENWPEVAYYSALRLRTESAAQGGIMLLDRAADHLGKVQGVDQDYTTPVVPTIYKAGGLRLSLFSTIAQFGTPVDLTLDDLRIELFFPADEATESALRSLSNA